MKRIVVSSKKNFISYNFGMRRIYFGEIGENVRASDRSNFGHSENIFIGNNVFLGPELYMDAISKIYIGNGTMIGPRCTFIGGTHNYNADDLKAIPFDNIILDRTITIGDNVWIAADVTICPGTTVGEGVVVGAGACIYGNIPAYSVVVANGYRIIKERNNEYYERLKEKNAIYNVMYAGEPFIVRKEAKT